MEEHFGIDQVGERWRTLARTQKVSAGVLAVCAVFTLALSVQRLHARVHDPFAISKTELREATEVVATIDVQGRELEESKRRDTDGDGLSDYDEENILGTSPYLADTDGDRVPDNVELALGESPNCARGEQCANSQLDTSTVRSRNLFEGIQVEDTGETFFAEFQKGINERKAQVREQTGSTSTELDPVLVRDPDEIRALLLESGDIDPDLINQLTDDDLLQLYDEALVISTQKEKEAFENSVNGTSL